MLLQVCGYNPLFAEDMALVIAFFLAILAILVVLILKDCIVRLTNCTRCGRRMHSPSCQNFILRFVYEFLLEFCICVTFQLSVHDFADFSPTLQFGISAVLLAAIVGFFALIISLFMCRGPWILGFYTKSTSIGSLF